MKTVRYSTKFRKDIKRYAHKADMIDALMEIVKLLERGIPIPQENDPHKLKGNYKGCWECHIGNDYLLIWIDETSSTICLERLGTHHELFGK